MSRLKSPLPPHRQPGLSPVLILAMLAVLLVTCIFTVNRLTAGWQLDLTESQRYTLSEGSRSILEELQQPVTLRLFESEALTAELPQLRNHALEVRELLRTMQGHAGGKLDIRLINPEPFSEAEDQAGRYGLQGIPVNNGDTLYFGIAATNDLDGLQTMPFLSPDKARFLEYDLMRMIAALSRPDQPELTVLSSIPFNDEQGEPRWVVFEQWQQRYDINVLPTDDVRLQDTPSLLVVIHPAGLDSAWIPLIRNHVLEGRPLLLFVDPLTESLERTGDPATAADVVGLLAEFGLDYDPSVAIGDLQYALQVGRGAGQSPVRLLTTIGIGADALSDTDIVTADLSQINLSSAGMLQPAPGAAPVSVEPLISSSANAAPVAVSRILQLQDPADLRQGFNPTGQTYPLAMRLSGTDEKPLQLVVIADTDLLADRLWVQRQSLLGQTLLEPFADNGNLAVSAVDNLMGDNRLIALRARTLDQRPFTRVQQLRAEASQQLRATEERLEARLADTEQRLAELQSGRSDDQLSVLDAEQQQALDEFMQQRLQIRRELREVRRNLDLDIRQLESRLKFINIVLMPALIAVLGLVYFLRRRRQLQP